MQKKLERALFVLIVLTFLIPLVVVPSAFIFPFIVPKIILFRTIALLMLGTYILLFKMDKETYKMRATPLTIAVLLYFLSFAISTFVGVDWYKSFWDNHERMLGFFTLIHYGIYYVILTSCLKNWEQWRRLFFIFLSAGALVMVLGIMQVINPEFLLNKGSERVSATLGNAIYLGAYGMFISFVSLFFVVKEKKSAWKWYMGILSIFGLVGIFISGTKGVFLGFLAGLGVLVVAYSITLSDHKRVRQVLRILITAGILCFVLVFIFRETDFVRRIPIVGKLANLSLANGTGATRLMAWSIGVEGWREKPVFGWGPNNYYYAFNKYYRPKFLHSGYGETWFDNAHNASVNTLTVQGLFGFLAYLGLFAVPVWYLWKAYRQKNVDVHVAVFGSALLTSHFVQQLFVFENPTSYIYFFFFLAFVNWHIRPQDSSHRGAAVKPAKVSASMIAAVSIALLIVIYATNISPARANMNALNAIRSIYAGNDPIAAMEKAYQIPTPHADDIRLDLARTVVDTMNQYARGGNPEVAIKMGQKAFNDLMKNMDVHPYDIRIHLQLTHIAQVLGELTHNPEYVLRAEVIMEDALRKSPRRQQVYYSLAGAKFQLGKGEEVVKLLEESIELSPDISEGWWRLALVYKHLGQPEKAVEVIHRAYASGIRFDAQSLALLGDIASTTIDKTE